MQNDKTFAAIVVGLLIGALLAIAAVSLDGRTRVEAQVTQQDNNLLPVSHTTLSVTNTVVVNLTGVSGLLSPNGQNIRRCTVGPVESSSVRFWEDGTNPTSNQGHLLSIGAIYEVQNYQIATTWRVIATAVGGATIPVSCAR